MSNAVAEQFKNIAADLSQAIDKQDHAGALFVTLRRCAVQAARLTIQLLDTDRSPKWDSLRERFDVIARPINDADAWLGWRFAIGWMAQQYPAYVPSDASDADGIIPFGGIEKISIEQVRLWSSNTASACRLMVHLMADGTGEPNPVPDAHDDRQTLLHPSNIAMALLFERPDISPTELARLCGVSPSTLYTTTEKWKSVRATLMARKTGRIPTGSKDVDGHLEAEDFREDSD